MYDYPGTDLNLVIPIPSSNYFSRSKFYRYCSMDCQLLTCNDYILKRYEWECSHCTGTGQGPNAMERRKYSHWSEMGTSTYYFLFCQSRSLFRESRIEHCQLCIRQFSVIELSFEPTEDGIDFRHAETYFSGQIVYRVLQK